MFQRGGLIFGGRRPRLRPSWRIGVMRCPTTFVVLQQVSQWRDLYFPPLLQCFFLGVRISRFANFSTTSPCCDFSSGAIGCHLTWALLACSCCSWFYSIHLLGQKWRPLSGRAWTAPCPPNYFRLCIGGCFHLALLGTRYLPAPSPCFFW